MGSPAHARSERSLAARYAALIHVSKAINSHRDPKQLFATLAKELRHIVSFDFISVTLYDEPSHKISSHALATIQGEGFLLPPDFPPEETITWWIYHNQRPVVIPFVESEIRFPRVMEIHKRFGVKSFCLLPLTTIHRRLGGIGFGSGQADAFSEEEIKFLSLVADQIAVAVDDALNFNASQVAFEESQRAREQLEAKSERLNLLLELNNSVVSNLELPALLGAVTAGVRRVMQCDSVGVALPDPETNRLRLFGVDFPEDKGFADEHLISDDEVSAMVFNSGEPWVGTVRPGDNIGLGLASGLKSGCALPLISRNRVLGILSLTRDEGNHFTRDDLGFLTQIANQVAIAVENSLAYGEIAKLKDKLTQEVLYLEDEIRSEKNFEEIVGRSVALRRVLGQVETVGPTESTVLICGETGTGKELIARAVHNLSPRRSNAFVKLNCAAIPGGLLESELFGHERGAFTSAVAARIGRFELANRGTIFLDEIGEIPIDVQPKLLRVLEEREFERLGNSRSVRTDVRVIAATNHDLQVMVEARQFRSDLFYRLNVFPIHVPPLRERLEDIPLLVRHFVQQYARRTGKTITAVSAETIRDLYNYPWPGNIRELQNLIERAVILSSGPVLKIPISGLKPRSAISIPNSWSGAFSLSSRGLMHGLLEDVERRRILTVLEQTCGIVSGPNGAAACLGMKRSTLQFRMKKLGIPSRRG